MEHDILVIFDCFGVIFQEVAPFLFAHHFDKETAERLKQEYFVRADRGEITLTEVFLDMEKRFGFSVEDLQKEWDSLIVLDEKMPPVIAKIKRFCDLALLSNAAKGEVERIVKQFGLDELFDVVRVSSATGISKPDVRAYTETVKAFGKKYRKVYMIDDNPKNLDGLAAIGIEGVLFTEPEKLLRDMEEKLAQ